MASRLKRSGLCALVYLLSAATLSITAQAGAVEPLRIGMVPDAGATQVSV